jgi:hypothetical protein
MGVRDWHSADMPTDIDNDRMHFASGRSIKTNNKQQAKLTPSDGAKKGG